MRFGLIFYIRRYNSKAAQSTFDRIHRVRKVRMPQARIVTRPATIARGDEGHLSAVRDMQCTRATPVTLGIANTRMHKNPEKCIESAWNASKRMYCARDLSRLARFAMHVHTSVHFVRQEAEDL